MDLFFIDYDWIPILMQENYLKAMEGRNQIQDVMRMADAAECMSLGDEMNRNLRTNQNWSLLPDIGLLSSVAPSFMISGKCSFPAFPQWLGKNSSQRKAMRQIRELKHLMTVNAQAPRRSLQSEFVPLILRMLADYL